MVADVSTIHTTNSLVSTGFVSSLGARVGSEDLLGITIVAVPKLAYMWLVDLVSLLTGAGETSALCEVSHGA